MFGVYANSPPRARGRIERPEAPRRPTASRVPIARLRSRSQRLPHATLRACSPTPRPRRSSPTTTRPRTRGHAQAGVAALVFPAALRAKARKSQRSERMRPLNACRGPIREGRSFAFACYVARRDMASTYIREVSVTWETPFSAELWAEVERLAGKVEDDPLQDHVLSVLPDAHETRRATALVHRHGDKDTLHWLLLVSLPPSADPPQEIRDSDQRVGGRIGLAALLADSFAPGPQVGRFLVRLHLPESKFTCSRIPADPSEADQAALTLGQGARLEHVGYRYEGGGASGIEEVTLSYAHEKQRYVVQCFAKSPLKLSEAAWLPFADDISDLVQPAFFKERSESGVS